MNHLDLILSTIDNNKDSMIETLREAVKINSVAGEPLAGMPCGAGPTKALEHMISKGIEDGFAVCNIENIGGHIDLLPGEDADGETMGILAHLDVVPAGEDWSYDPFGGEIVDGKIYGRGTMDDKGPAVAAYYAMKAIKDCNLPLKKKVRLVLGVDEETGSKSMKAYLEKAGKPDFGFTPDADFPCVHGEMGIMTFELVKKLSKAGNKGLELRSIKGGHAHNMVPDSARAVVKSEKTDIYELIKTKAAAAREEGKTIKVRGMGKSLEITASGKSAHGAEPEKGINAISVLMDFLKDFDFVNESAVEFLDFYNNCIGFELNGESLGIGYEDQISGCTIVNVGMVNMDSKSVSLAVNVRFPISYDDTVLYDSMLPVISKYNIGVIKHMYQEAIFTDPGEELVTTLMDVYRESTGDYEAESMVIGGGTYARQVENFVAFGPLFPGDEDLIHQKDEYISIDRFVEMTKIYAKAIYRLCR